MAERKGYECFRCHARFHVQRAEERVLYGVSPLFCSLGCLVEHVRGMVPEGSPREMVESAGGEFSYADGSDVARVCYSPLLGVAVRSAFEARVLETLILGYGFECYYEPHLLGFGRKHYVPDIYLPEHGVWMEVKGLWRSGSRKKFMEAARALGEERVLLIPGHYRPWFESAARNLRNGQKRVGAWHG